MNIEGIEPDRTIGGGRETRTSEGRGRVAWKTGVKLRGIPSWVLIETLVPKLGLGRADVVPRTVLIGSAGGEEVIEAFS